MKEQVTKFVFKTFVLSMFNSFMFCNERSYPINMIALFNKYFSTRSIDECVLQLCLDNFMNYPRVLAIKNSALKIDFSFEPFSISRVAECLANINTMKSDGPDRL